MSNSPLPESGGCCHWGVEPVAGQVRITPAIAAPLVGFYDTVRNVLPPDIPCEEDGGQWRVSAEHARVLAELGIPFQAEEAGLRINPDDLILTIDETVPDILDSLDAEYQVVGGECWVDPDQLGLPEIFGRPVEY